MRSPVPTRMRNLAPTCMRNPTPMHVDCQVFAQSIASYSTHIPKCLQPPPTPLWGYSCLAASGFLVYLLLSAPAALSATAMHFPKLRGSLRLRLSHPLHSEASQPLLLGRWSVGTAERGGTEDERLPRQQEAQQQQQHALLHRITEQASPMAFHESMLVEAGPDYGKWQEFEEKLEPGGEQQQPLQQPGERQEDGDTGFQLQELMLRQGQAAAASCTHTSCSSPFVAVQFDKAVGMAGREGAGAVGWAGVGEGEQEGHDAGRGSEDVEGGCSTDSAGSWRTGEAGGLTASSSKASTSSQGGGFGLKMRTLLMDMRVWTLLLQCLAAGYGTGGWVALGYVAGGWGAALVGGGWHLLVGCSN